MKALEQIDRALPERIRSLPAGKKELIKAELRGTHLHLSVQATVFKLGNKSYKLVSFQDIGSELEAREVESWQKLIRVLTHEIMNSVIPIATLTSVINEMLQEKAAQNLPYASGEEDQDIRNSLQTIENRSKGLISFVRAYASLTQTAKPVMREVLVADLFTRVYTLLRPDIEKKHIQLNILLPQENLTILADPELLEQVLINLLLNAIDAVENKDNPAIELTAGVSGSNQTILQVKDNGTGMDEQVLENIFVPFFTTKKKGSGIGLSLSRQIMLLHQGNITVQSTKGKGTVVKLYLQQL